ncbi:MAG TPA: hypothetical protein VKP65_17655, partial [Rhodothermales bacterium]|nr:hypothetical protein [Rhodothermales bacterium]
MKTSMKKTPFSIALAFVTLVAMATAPAMMTVTFDPLLGTGFAGKGDVQLALGYNNKQLQDNAGSLVFTASSVSETTWECYNSNNEKIQERLRTMTTQGVVSGVARERNQITGF